MSRLSRFICEVISWFNDCLLSVQVPSVLWRCWLGDRKGIRPVKTEWWGAGVVICLERGAGLHMAQLMPLPLTVSCFSKIQTGFTFLVPAHPVVPEKGPINGCVCVCVIVIVALDGDVVSQWRIQERFIIGSTRPARLFLPSPCRLHCCCPLC